MEEDLQTVTPADPETACTYELLILYTLEAHEWAAYLQQILKSSKKFRKKSILLYAVSPEDQLHGYNFDCFQSCKCIVVLLTGAFLENLIEPELQGALLRLLCPPHRVVALLCGIPDDLVLTERFADWPYWRKLYADDEPPVYVSTVLESVNESWKREAEDEKVQVVTPAPSTENPTPETEEVVSEEQKESDLKDVEAETSVEDSENTETSSADHLSCLTVQPNRVRCGDEETIFIVFKDRIDHQSELEVEFSLESTDTKRIQATVENDYTLSVTAPDFPAGVVSLTLFTDQWSVSLKPVTYYTNMEEVSRFLENATDPVNFICQAFSLMSSSKESLDNMLTECLKSKMPATGLQLFGVRQIEEDNMATCQRNEELPTLLHFAAKYGLKKLTTALLQCPGALQAYSVMNKNGDYPNTLAEKSGFSDLRQFMDEFVETADMLKSHLEETVNNTEEDGEVYEMMSTSSQDIMMKYSGCSEDIYESMLGLDPDCAEDLYEVMSAVEENPEEAMLRKFFQAKPHNVQQQSDEKEPQTTEEEIPECNNFYQIDEEEDPYNLNAEDIYDTVDQETMYSPIVNRPPAPVPRPDPEPEREQEKPMTYISRVFSDKGLPQINRESTERSAPTRRISLNPAPLYDPYAGMKTPGQRQLISLQERVKVGEITVDEAVQEFKSWQFDHERRSQSLRYQQDNLKRLRDSITRRHKEREKAGQIDYEISSPMQTNLYWTGAAQFECDVYEPMPRVTAPPPPAAAQAIQRGNWKTGSTSSNSSTESNRLSTHSTVSYSSGTEPDLEDTLESVPLPPRPARPSDPPPLVPPPRIPPRIPERVPEKMLHERYISCPTRALPQIPPHRHTDIAPPVPRRLR